MIMTNLWRHMGAISRAALTVVGTLFLKTAAEGAATQTYVAAHNTDAGLANGVYTTDFLEAVNYLMGGWIAGQSRDQQRSESGFHGGMLLRWGRGGRGDEAVNTSQAKQIRANLFTGREIFSKEFSPRGRENFCSGNITPAARMA